MTTLQASFSHAPCAHAPRTVASRRLVVGLSLIILVPGALVAQQTVRLGSEFQVNTYTLSQQTVPAVARNSGGQFVVTWTSFFQDADMGGVFARRFNASGVPQGVEFRVNSHTEGSQARSAVGLRGNGDFVVAWPSQYQDGSGFGIFAQRFASSGSPQGAEFQVNSHTVDTQYDESIAIAGNGDFIVVWSGGSQDGSANGIFGQRFASSGAPKGAEFIVNTVTLGNQYSPSVGADIDGGFVVVWRSYDGGGYGIFGRRFNTAGVPGVVFQVNTYTPDTQAAPWVAMNDNGDFAVAWLSEGQDGNGGGIFAQRFNALAAPQGVEFQVNSYTASVQGPLSADLSNDGDLVVTWDSASQDGSSYGIFSRRFGLPGTSDSGELQVNSFTPGFQRFSVVAMEGDGDFVIAWQSNEQDGNYSGIFAQRFATLAVLDIDGNGDVAALTDGLLVLRFLFGFTGTTLTTGAVGNGCTRCNAGAIEPYLQGLV